MPQLGYTALEELAPILPPETTRVVIDFPLDDVVTCYFATHATAELVDKLIPKLLAGDLHFEHVPRRNWIKRFFRWLGK